MAQKHNSKDLQGCYYGTTTIKEIYCGSSLVWKYNRVLYLGTSTSFNVKSSYPDIYASLSTNNFFFTTCDSITYTDVLNNVGAETGYSRITQGRNKSYSNGTLSFYNYLGGNGTAVNGKVKAVLVTKPSELRSLGTATSFNVSSISGYQNFNVNNFLIKNWTPSSNYIYNQFRGYEGRWTATNTKSLVKAYNSSTGVLTCYIRDVGSSNTGDSWDSTTACEVYLTLDRPQ